MKHHAETEFFENDDLESAHSIVNGSTDKPGLRPSSLGRVLCAYVEMKREQRFPNRPLNQPSDYGTVLDALYEMKGLNFVQEGRQDDSTIQILLEIKYAYQIDLVVDRFKKSGETYPSPDAITRILIGLDNEGVFGPYCQ